MVHNATCRPERALPFAQQCLHSYFRIEPSDISSSPGFDHGPGKAGLRSLLSDDMSRHQRCLDKCCGRCFILISNDRNTRVTFDQHSVQVRNLEVNNDIHRDRECSTAEQPEQPRAGDEDAIHTAEATNGSISADTLKTCSVYLHLLETQSDVQGCAHDKDVGRPWRV